MKNNVHPLLNPPSYMLSADGYDDLRAIRGKLQLLGQLAGTEFALGSSDIMLLVPRALIGQLFIDLSFQVGHVIDTLTCDAENSDGASAH